MINIDRAYSTIASLHELLKEVDLLQKELQTTRNRLYSTQIKLESAERRVEEMYAREKQAYERVRTLTEHFSQVLSRQPVRIEVGVNDLSETIKGSLGLTDRSEKEADTSSSPVTG